MSDAFVPVFAIFCVFGLPIGAYIISRYLRHQERVEMIRHGMVPPPRGAGKRAYRDWQRAQQQGFGPGPYAAGPGPAPGPYAAGPYAAGPQVAPDDDDPQRALSKGIRVAMIGLALTIGLSFINPGHYGPWMLGGLIPLFVGIAQMITAVLAGAQIPPGLLGNRSNPNVTYWQAPPPPPGPRPAPPPPPSAASSASWDQPGRPHFEELSKPVPPPDLR